MKKKFLIATTIAPTLGFFKGQPRIWKESFDVLAVSSEIDVLRSFTEDEGIRYKYMPMHREISLWSDLMCFIRWLCLLLKERPYIVHGNTPKASMLSIVAAWITRRPVRIYMCHGLRYQGTQGKMRKLLMFMEHLTCMCATHVISVSKGVVNVLVDDGLCTKEKISVIGDGSAGGVDVNRFNPLYVVSDVRSDLGIDDDSIVFCFIGRIVKDKGVNELVESFDKLYKNHKNVHLLLVGSKETIQNPVSSWTDDVIKNNPHIHAVGSQKDVRPYLKASNIFVLPSYREGFGMVLIEAGAMGLPCITTNITGCNEVIVNGENGNIIEPRNTVALYEEMDRWYNHPDEVKRMGAASRVMVESRYECHRVWERYYEFYKSL